MCVCVCVRACVRACVHACMRACVYAHTCHCLLHNYPWSCLEGGNNEYEMCNLPAWSDPDGCSVACTKTTNAVGDVVVTYTPIRVGECISCVYCHRALISLCFNREGWWWWWW